MLLLFVVCCLLFVVCCLLFVVVLHRFTHCAGDMPDDAWTKHDHEGRSYWVNSITGEFDLPVVGWCVWHGWCLTCLTFCFSLKKKCASMHQCIKLSHCVVFFIENR